MSEQPRDPLAFAELPLLWGDGVHDDTAALQAALRFQPVRCGRCMEVMRPGAGLAVTVAFDPGACSCPRMRA